MNAIELCFIDNCYLRRTSNTAVIYCKAVSCVQHAAWFGPKGYRQALCKTYDKKTHGLYYTFCTGDTRTVPNVVHTGDTRPVLKVVHTGDTRPVLKVVHTGDTRPVLKVVHTGDNKTSRSSVRSLFNNTEIDLWALK